MKLLFGKSGKEAKVKSQEEKIVLFVCVENAARSQMAEAFFRKYAPRGYMTVSAGTRPAGEINPVVIKAMKEVDIEIAILLRMSNNMIKTASSICFNIFLFMLFNIPDPKWFIL
jgi:predicted protein tyrosine phosphatase